MKKDHYPIGSRVRWYEEDDYGENIEYAGTVIGHVPNGDEVIVVDDYFGDRSTISIEALNRL